MKITGSIFIKPWKNFSQNIFPLNLQRSNCSITVPPGGATFATNTFTYHNYAIPNIATITWKDNFSFPRFDIAFSSSAQCGAGDVDLQSDKLLSTKAPAEAVEAMSVNLAEVFPNPVSKSIRVYLTLDNNQATNIELYSIDGRRLVSKTVTE
ncbi:MAG: T9SS type A sorting domain-containing protein, partial [Ginsengibacter sp.]